jgi:serine/threonine-protein kinase
VLKHPKRVALLAYLAVARPNGFHRRDTLLGLFWPEHDTSHARMSLRQALCGLRRDLGSDVIITRGREDVRLNCDRCVCDAQEFGAAMAAGDWERSVALYEGPFLRGLYVSGAPGFERWVEDERDRLARAYADAIEKLAVGTEDPAEAVRRWQQLADHDPYSSHVTVELMRALLTAGDRAAAIHAAVKHSSVLNTDLETAPDPEVTEFARKLRGERTDLLEAVTVDVLAGATKVPPTQSTTPRPSSRQPSMGVRAATLALLALFVILGTPLRSGIARLIDAPMEPAAALSAWEAMSAEWSGSGPPWTTIMGDSLLVFPLGLGTLLTYDGSRLDYLLVEDAWKPHADGDGQIEMQRRLPALDLPSTSPTDRDFGPKLLDGEDGAGALWTTPRIPEWILTALANEPDSPDGRAGTNRPACVVVHPGQGARVLEQCGVMNADESPTIVLLDKEGNLKRIIH